MKKGEGFFEMSSKDKTLSEFLVQQRTILSHFETYMRQRLPEKLVIDNWKTVFLTWRMLWEGGTESENIDIVMETLIGGWFNLPNSTDRCL